MSAVTARRLAPRTSPAEVPDPRSPRVLPRTTATATAKATATASAALRLVPQARSSAPRAPFIAMVVLLLVGGLIGLLCLNTLLAQDAFRLHTLVKEQKALVDREQTLEREVETLRTPRNLAERARELGMVQGSTPAFLRLEDGAVLGAEVPAGEDVPGGGTVLDLPVQDSADAGADEEADADGDADRDATTGEDSSDETGTDADSDAETTEDP